MNTGPLGTAQLQADMAESMQRYWDATAESYAGHDHFEPDDPRRRAWSLLLARMFPPTEPKKILDVGCGSGFVALSLAELGHRVVGLDISPEMLRMCGTAAEVRGLTNLALVRGAAEQPPPDLGPVDAVISRHVLWTLPWPEQAVRAWAALVRPGGRVVAIDSLWSPQLISDMDDRDYPPEVTRFLPLLHARHLNPARNLWRRAGLGRVMAERLAWIDGVLRTRSPAAAATMYQNLSFYFVEGIRPVSPRPDLHRGVI
ncbi:class I SAM-dependent methyltransferase [Spirillospora sp. NPDC052242]